MSRPILPLCVASDGQGVGKVPLYQGAEGKLILARILGRGEEIMFLCRQGRSLYEYVQNGFTKTAHICTEPVQDSFVED